MKIPQAKSQFLLFLVVVFILTTGQGCFIKLRNKEEVPVTFDGGIHKSTDQGATWQPSNDLLSTTGPEKINTVNVLDFIFDPRDRDVFYLLTDTSGVFLTLDSGKSWMQVRTLGSSVGDISVDPKDVCTVYAGVRNQVLKSTDCNRSFNEVFHTDPARNIISVAVDFRNSNIVYAANNSELLMSKDSGVSWQINSRFTGGITNIVMRDVRGSQVIYVLTQTDYFYRSLDNGVTWQHMKEFIKNYTKRSKGPIKSFTFDDSGANSLMVLVDEGILRSKDGGETWEAVTILSASRDITAAAVLPNDPNVIFYATPRTFYRSNDGGENWITADLPIGPRVAKKLIIDKINPNIMYIGAYLEPQPEK